MNNVVGNAVYVRDIPFAARVFWVASLENEFVGHPHLDPAEIRVSDDGRPLEIFRLVVEVCEKGAAGNEICERADVYELFRDPGVLKADEVTKEIIIDRVAARVLPHGDHVSQKNVLNLALCERREGCTLVGRVERDDALYYWKWRLRALILEMLTYITGDEPALAVAEEDVLISPGRVDVAD